MSKKDSGWRWIDILVILMVLCILTIFFTFPANAQTQNADTLNPEWPRINWVFADVKYNGWGWAAGRNLVKGTAIRTCQGTTCWNNNKGLFTVNGVQTIFKFPVGTNVSNADFVVSVDGKNISMPMRDILPLKTAPVNPIKIAWAAPASTGITGYKIYYNRGSAPTTASSFVRLYPDNRFYMLNSLTPGTWYFTIVAIDITGESRMSAIVSKVIQ